MLLIGIIIFSAVQSAAVKFYNRTDSDAFVFNFVKSLAACAALAVLSAADFHINALTAAYGAYTDCRSEYQCIQATRHLRWDLCR